MRLRSLVLFVCVFGLAGGFAVIAREGGLSEAALDCSSVGDATITARVKEKLSSAPSLKEARIEVVTREGVVTLSGSVKSAGLKGVATRMTKRVECVKKVDNRLSIEQGRGSGKG